MLRPKYSTPIQELWTELRVMKEYTKSNIASAAELRTSFIIQIVGMTVNNIVFLMAWWLFFRVFGEINGWSGREVIGLEGFVALVFGVAFTFFPGIGELPSVINNGSFDNLMLTPRNIYLRILTLVTRPSAIGDMLYGAVALVVYVVIAGLTIGQVALLLLTLIPAIVIFTNFTLVASCISFYIPDSLEVAKNIFEVMFGPSLYPAGVFQGALRIGFLYVLPTLAIGGLPIEAVKDFDLTKVAVVWGLAVVWALIAQHVLRQGIRHYESGNLTGARV